MAHISPYSALGHGFDHPGNVSYAMRLDPIIGFMWRHEYPARDEDKIRQ